MSNYVFPVLAGLSWNVTKTPMWSTKVQIATSGKELRSAWFSAPKYTFKLKYDVLRSAAAYAELQSLVGFFNARQGSYDSFLYTDPTDNTVTAQAFGTGNGVATVFPLYRTYGSNNELTMNINAITGIYDNGTPVVEGSGAGKYTIDTLGNVTFGTAPVAAHNLTATFSYYYRCRFSKDESNFENFMYNLWSLSELELVGSLGNKV
jgi:uncharacterized protein (TIGR02217 family)